MRLASEQLRYLALMALEDLVEKYRDRPCGKTLWLRFLLAWLFRESGADPEKKWLFTSFWKALTTPFDASHFVDSYARFTTIEAALNGISREVGWERTLSYMQEMNARRRAFAEKGSGPSGDRS